MQAAHLSLAGKPALPRRKRAKPGAALLLRAERASSFLPGAAAAWQGLACSWAELSGIAHRPLLLSPHLPSIIVRPLLPSARAALLQKIAAIPRAHSCFAEARGAWRPLSLEHFLALAGSAGKPSSQAPAAGMAAPLGTCPAAERHELPCRANPHVQGEQACMCARLWMRVP